MLMRPTKYVAFLMLFILTQLSLFGAVGMHINADHLVQKQDKFQKETEDIISFHTTIVKPLLPHEDSKSKDFPLFVIENEKETEDDEELTSYEKYLKCFQSFITIFYLSEKEFFQSTQEENFSKQLISSSSEQLLYLELQVFRI